MPLLTKKQFVALFFSTVCTCQVYGAYSVLSNIQDQLDQLQAKVEQIDSKSALGKRGAKLAGGLPAIKDPQGISMEIDLVYFKTQLGGTNFAFSNAFSNTAPPFDATIQQVNFSMELGLKVAIEKLFIEEDWGLKGIYTHFRTSDSKSKSGNSNTQMPLKGLLLQNPVNSVKALAKVKWNDLEIVFNKCYFINKNFSLEPAIGLRTSWVDLEQWSRYIGGTELGYNNTLHVKDRSNYFGIGPDIYNKALWYLSEGFSLAGFIDIGLEYGLFKVSYDENKSDDTSNTIHFHDTQRHFCPVFDFGITLNYGWYSYQDKVYINTSLGYEAIFFLNQNQMFEVSQNQTSGYRIKNMSEDLSFNGLTASFSITF